MARFYANENIALQVVIELRRLGNDVLTSREAGKANAAVPDPEVLKFAASEGRILLTHNRRHFLRLHQHRTEGHRESPSARLTRIMPDKRIEFTPLSRACPTWRAGWSA